MPHLYSIALLGAYLLTFWFLRHTAVAAVCFGAVLLPFMTGRVRLTWKDAILLCITLAALPRHLGSDYELQTLAQVVGFGWALSVVSQNAIFTPATGRLIVWCVLISSCALAGVMLFQVAPGQFSFSLSTVLARDRAEGWYLLGDNPAGAPTIASILGVAIVSCLALLGGRCSAFKFALLLGLVGALVLSCGRGAMLATSVVILLYLVTLRHTTAWGRIRMWGLAVALPVMGLSPLVGFLEQYQSRGFSDRLETLMRLETDNSVEGRFAMWRHGVDLAASDAGGYGYRYFWDLEGLTLHNEFLAQTVGGGWAVGALFVALMWFLSIRAGRLLWRSDGGHHAQRFLCAGMLVLGVMLGMSENWSLSSNGIFYPFFWLNVGLLLNLSFVGEIEAVAVRRRGFRAEVLETIPEKDAVAQAA